MNKNMAIAIGILSVIVLAGFFVVPALFPAKTSMTVTFYDADDNVVWLERSNPGFFEFDFVTEAGAEVTKATVAVDYVVSGHESGNTVNIGCTFYVDAHLRTITGGFAGDAEYVCRVQTTATGTFTHDFYFADFVGVESTGKTWGWYIEVDATLIAREYLPGTTTLVATATPWTATLAFNLDWSEPAAFTIVGSDFNFGPT
jgi:hypothetical protein